MLQRRILLSAAQDRTIAVLSTSVFTALSGVKPFPTGGPLFDNGGLLSFDQPPCTQSRFDELTVDFDGHFKLHGINWALGSNEHWAITGPNGSGKSALASVIAGEGQREEAC